jgi:hypothetical protein
MENHMGENENRPDARVRIHGFHLEVPDPIQTPPWKAGLKELWRWGPFIAGTIREIACNGWLFARRRFA